MRGKTQDYYFKHLCQIGMQKQGENAKESNESTQSEDAPRAGSLESRIWTVLQLFDKDHCENVCNMGT